MENKAYHSGDSEADNSMTPTWVVKRIQDVTGLTLVHDVCASELTARCESHWNVNDDCLTRGWFQSFKYFNLNTNKNTLGRNAFWMNPPFSQASDFTTKAAYEAMYGVTTLGLVRHAPDSDWFQEMEKHATFIFVPDGRINFVKSDGTRFKNGANFPTCFPLWTPYGNNGIAQQIRFNRNKKDYV